MRTNFALTPAAISDLAPTDRYTWESKLIRDLELHLDEVSMNTKNVIIGVLLVVVLLLAGATVKYMRDAYYYKSLYENSLKQCSAELSRYTVRVDLLIEHDGVKRWYNGTTVPVGATLLNATEAAVQVKYTWGKYGAFVESINGISNNPSNKTYWIYWVWDSSSKSWKIGSVAASSYKLRDGDVICWYYESTSTWPPEPPR